MPKFQRRHYEAIADVLANLHLESDRAAPMRAMQWELTAKKLADMFENDNPRFKRERFARACKWQPNRLAA